MIVLGCDPGLADFGWCAIELLDEPVSMGLFGKPVTERLVDWGHIVTKPGKEGVGRKCDHNARRIEELRAELLQAMYGQGTTPRIVCAEAMSWPHPPELDVDLTRQPTRDDLEHASKKLAGKTFGALASAAQLAMAWGVLGSLAGNEGIPIMQVSPQTMRKRLGVERTGGKLDVQDALVSRYGEAWLGGVLQVPKSNREHITDAIGAVVACLDEPQIRKMRGTLLRTPTDLSDIDFG